MLIQDLVDALGTIAPLDLAEPWDKVGLLAGDRARVATGPVVLTIDLTEAVLAEAVAAKASAVIAYHPPIWDPLTRITDATPRQRIILRALEAGIAIYSPHTALDAVKGGITDWLCEGLSGGSVDPDGPAGRIAGDCRALTPHARTASTQQVKIVTFVGADAAARLRETLATAGAGVIGDYQVCSFAAPGTGTFLGGPTTKPRTGQSGQIEEVKELRLEMVCARAALPLAIETLRQFHPYEEPAIDVYDLVAQPQRTMGAGRRLVLDRPVAVGELAQRLKAWIRRDRVRFALCDGDEHRLVRFIGVCPGAGSSLSKIARQEGCEVFVTGEMAHHDVMGALHAGMSIVLGNHTSTERGYLPRLAAMLRDRLPGIACIVSKADRDPLVTV
ncbi:MAG: Nif3-like dinuclear metal center hexameric protein [Phycisphaerae bacterium]|jgi:dinuclear metal center YbgI/SA1388 family protein